MDTCIVPWIGQVGRSIQAERNRDVTAAKAFFRKAIKGRAPPKTITLDGYAASHRAVRELNADARWGHEAAIVEIPE